MSETLTLHSADGDFRAYVARPKVQMAPAVAVLQEISGVNTDMRTWCDELAAKGLIDSSQAVSTNDVRLLRRFHTASIVSGHRPRYR